jgi:hypothetical protein
MTKLFPPILTISIKSVFPTFALGDLGCDNGSGGNPELGKNPEHGVPVKDDIEKIQMPIRNFWEKSLCSRKNRTVFLFSKLWVKNGAVHFFLQFELRG